MSNRHKLQIFIILRVLFFIIFLCLADRNFSHKLLWDRMQRTRTILIAKIKVGRFFDVPSWVQFFLQSCLVLFSSRHLQGFIAQGHQINFIYFLMYKINRSSFCSELQAQHHLTSIHTCTHSGSFTENFTVSFWIYVVFFYLIHLHEYRLSVEQQK